MSSVVLVTIQSCPEIKFQIAVVEEKKKEQKDVADKEYRISYCLLSSSGEENKLVSFSVVSGLMGEFQKAKGGMFLQTSEI